jgi:uncharacterized protein (TIGR02646 family)
VIQVKRTVPAPDALTRKGAREHASVLELFERDGRRDERYKFSAYRQKAVAKALSALFHRKCAYCESVIGHVQPVDIEHFRPKAAVLVEGALRYPGYYWLASDWDNLLPSCIMCNRPNRHDGPDPVEDGELLGKGNHFPVRDEACRVSHSSGHLPSEGALLLDPCSDVPDEHLEFDEQGLVRPRVIQGSESDRGECTIQVLGLRRPDLVHARQALAVKVLGQLALIDDAVAAYQGSGGEVGLKERIYRQAAYLEVFLGPGEPYLAMVRAMIDRRQPGLRDRLPEIAARVRARDAPGQR